VIKVFFLDRHTSDTFKIILEDVLKTYDVDQSKMHMLLRDAASNMISLTEKMKVNSADCLAHKIALACL
jgi:hypothetical protein